MNEKTVKELVNRAMKKDNQAMEQLYKEYYPDVLFACKKYELSESDAADIAQDTFIKAFTALNQLSDATKFKPWLVRIASNSCLNLLKRNNIIRMESIEVEEGVMDIPDNQKSSLDVVIDEEVARVLEQIIEKLPVEQRVTVFMFYYQELSVKEIAQAYGCSENTVRSRLNYAKKAMQREVEKLENNGIKLRATAALPFLYLLYTMEREAFACEIPECTALLAGVMKNSISGTVSGTTPAGATSAGTTAAAGIESVKSAGKMFGLPKLAVILAGGILAAGVIAGGIFLGVSGGSKDKKEPVANTEYVETYGDGDTTTENVGQTEEETTEKVTEDEFDPNHWDKTLYINDVKVTFPCRFEDFDIAPEGYYYWSRINYEWKTISFDDEVTVADIGNQSIYVEDENQKFSKPSISFDIVPGTDRDSVMRWGDFRVELFQTDYDSESSDLTESMLPNMKFTEDGKSLYDMTFDEVVEVLGTPKKSDYDVYEWQFEDFLISALTIKKSDSKTYICLFEYQYGNDNSENTEADTEDNSEFGENETESEGDNLGIVEWDEGEQDGFQYMADSELKKVYITGYTGSDTEWNIPESINGISDIIIDSDAFSYNESVTKVRIPATVSLIDENAFAHCSNLSEITFGEGRYTFDIGCEAFTGTAITSLVIPGNCNEIGKGAFKSCEVLESLVVMDGVNKIQQEAFQDSALTKVELPDSIKVIDMNAFTGTKLTTFKVPAGVSILDGILDRCEQLETLYVPEGVTLLTGSSMEFADGIREIHLPASVDEFFEEGFSRYENLKSVHFYAPEGSKIEEFLSQNGYQVN